MAYSEDDEREDRFFIAGVDNVGLKREQYRTNLLRKKVLITAGIIIGVIACIALLFGIVFGVRRIQHLEYECPNMDFDNKPDLVFFVVGDWGRNGIESQQTAARMMQDVGANCMQPAFIISTGDNFYENGLQSTTDPQFETSFTKVYTGSALQVPWYAVLGNHDYALSLGLGDLGAAFSATKCRSGLTPGCFSPLWQVGTHADELNKRDTNARWHCQQGVLKQTFLDGQMDIIFIDTNPLIQRYHQEWAANVSGGIASQNQLSIITELDKYLSNSDAPWKIVVGHHPVYSYGEHCLVGAMDCADMQATIQPLLRKYKVDAYFNGHDHDLQLIRMPNETTTYVVSGAGSNVRTGEFDGQTAKGTAQSFLRDDQGFVAAVVRGAEMTLYFYASKSQEVAFEVTLHQ